MPRQQRHALDMVLRYEHGRPVFGVLCTRCGLATVEPLEAEPQTEFAWQLVRNEVTRRFDAQPCELPRSSCRKAPPAPSAAPPGVRRR
jgi:hypothetical protein